MGREENGNADNNSTTTQLSTIGFACSGNYDYRDGFPGAQSSGGSYWSHTSNGETKGFFLNFIRAYFYMRDIGDRGRGYALRCLAC